MSTITLNSTQDLLRDYDENSNPDTNQNSVFQSIRTEAAADFRRLGIPASRHEEWKYFNLTPLSKINFRKPAVHTFSETKDTNQYRFAGKDAILFFIENGTLNSQLSGINSLPDGITVGTLSELSSDPRVQKHYAKHADSSNQHFVSLNTATSTDAIVILIDNKIKCDKPIQLVFLSEAISEPIMIPLRTLVIAGQDSECTVIESYHSTSDSHPVFINAVSEVVIEKDARLHYSKLQVENGNTFHINYHQVNQGKNSYQHITTVSLGGSMLRNNLHIRLDDVNCETHLNGLSVLDGTQVIDNHTMVDHAMPECFSNELYKNIIGGKAQGVFNGKILVRKDAQKTNAYQSNKNILLSNDASMNAKPQLEIFADDVKCSHGATTGQIDEEALFYLRARGIGETEARALLNHAFASSVINQVESDSLKESMMVLLSQKLRFEES